LLKLLPSNNANSSSYSGGTKFQSDIDEEIDVNFAGKATILFAKTSNNSWILDTGATDHIAVSSKVLDHAKTIDSRTLINLPNGQTSEAVCIGTVKLSSYFTLQNVLCVPSFKYNLLSVSKLAKDSKVRVSFYDDCCVI